MQLNINQKPTRETPTATDNQLSSVVAFGLSL